MYQKVSCKTDAFDKLQNELLFKSIRREKCATFEFQARTWTIFKGPLCKIFLARYRSLSVGLHCVWRSLFYQHAGCWEQLILLRQPPPPLQITTILLGPETRSILLFGVIQSCHYRSRFGRTEKCPLRWLTNLLHKEKRQLK